MLPGNKYRFDTVLPAVLMLMLSLLVPALSYAAALGDELILSQLGDPVEVEISLLQWEDIELDQLQISAGTPQVYESFGLDYLPALENLNFNVVGPNLNGEVKVLVSSREPMIEPYLELLLVLRWPGGSLLREYVLLFDPPRSRSPVATAAVAAPRSATPLPVEAAVTAPQPVVAAEPEPIPEPEPGAVTESQESLDPEPTSEVEPTVQQTAELSASGEQESVPEQAPMAEVSDAGAEEVVPQAEEIPAVTTDTAALTIQQGSTYMVQSGDNLWDIATKYGPVGANANLYQILLSMYELNRGAFVNGNISLLKYGVTLRLPSVADVADVDPATAQSLFDQRWNEGSERIDMAARGEPLPPLSSIFAPEVVRPEINPTAGIPPGSEEPPTETDTGEFVIAPRDTAVPAPAQISAPTPAFAPTSVATVTQNQASDLGLPVSTLQTATSPTPPPFLAPNTAVIPPPTIAIVEAETITLTSTNPYLEGVNTSAQFIQEMLAARQQQAEQLEAQMSQMSTRMLEVSQVTQRLNTSLEEALAERDKQQKSVRRDTFLFGGLIVVMSAALIGIVVMVVKLAAQIRVQYECLQRSMKVQALAAVPNAGNFTERAGQSKNLPDSPKTVKVEKKLQKTVGQALAVAIIDEEEGPGSIMEQSSMHDELHENPDMNMSKEELSVSLGDMEIDHPEEDGMPKPR